MRRLIPQFLARFFCGRFLGHRRRKFESIASADVAKATGIVQMSVETCMCGEDQIVTIVDDKVQHPRRKPLEREPGVPIKGLA